MRLPSAVLLGSLVSWAAFGQTYTISTYAGGVPPPTPVSAVNASIGPVLGVALDASGNLYFSSMNCVFRMDPNGVLTRVAGNSRAGYSGDGGPAVNAQLNSPIGVAIDAAGSVYVADFGNHLVRKVSAAGIITTVAGNGGFGSIGDGGPATAAQIDSPSGLTLDSAGDLYIADYTNSNIRMVSPGGIISTVAGNGTAGYSGDGGPAVRAQLTAPSGLVVDGGGNLYIYDAMRVRRVGEDGVITTVAGGGASGLGDGGPATSAQLGSSGTPSGGLALDGAGNLYIADPSNERVRKVSPSGTISTIAGKGLPSYSGDGEPATNSALYQPQGVAADGAGNLYIADSFNFRLRKVAADGTISTKGGNGFCCYSGDGGPATGAQINGSGGLAIDSSGNVYIADNWNHVVRRISPNGTIGTLAGNGTEGYSGDGGSATAALLGSPQGLAVDSGNNVYIADGSNNRVRVVSPDGIITTFAGNGQRGYSGDGGPATSAQFNNPRSMAIDSAGNLFIVDLSNNCVRKVSPAGIITTVVSSGNGALVGLAVDAGDNLYISDGSKTVRKVSPDGTITIVAGNGSLGYSGDGGQAVNAQLYIPSGLATDGAGNLYIADGRNERIREVSPTGIITTIAGNGGLGYSGDGGPAISAQFYFPDGLAADTLGNIFVADVDSGTPYAGSIRLLQPSGVRSAASNLQGPIAPGEIVAITGTGLGPTQLVSATPAGGFYGTQLAGTTVQFNGTPAPMIYTSASQIAVVVPYSVSSGTAQVTVMYQGQTAASFSLTVAPSSPSLFTSNSTGKGQASVLNQNGSVNSASNPAAIGDVIVLYATGEGQTTPAGVDGKVASVPLPHPNLPVTVTLGGQTVTPTYAGAAPGEVAGVMQINVQIPTGIQTSSAVPVNVQVGGTSSPTGVTIAVQ